MSGVYDGLTVVELADRRNQWTGELLADGGARVIQIERGAASSHRSLIYTSLTDFGEDGPWRDYQMNDAAHLQMNDAAHLALCGHMASTGYSDPSQQRDFWRVVEHPETDATDRFGEYNLPVFGPPEEGP